ncbi:hypothetical protein AUK40_01275 [Candidatus Wirthbacteria bacterium CG2_30_54_11]|uniref:Uncharacterized protein n=1 Tax=Candidatus Wirthbacteria bacterium CG2_30_54_11 TaxID=1817892 RepID=A0A1J5IWG4_9BACT|nr:MAG: hypothetical protein AUK40_01275 [Candidatus Wirthbacteria bacterium CG2_30_54_11]
MSLKLYLLGIALTSISAFIIWLGVIFSIDPSIAAPFEFVLFYGSLFLFLCGTLTLAGFYVRLLRSNNEFYYGNLLTSLRQASLFSLFATSSLALKGFRVISYVEISLLFIATLLFELYFSAKK